MLRLEDVVKRYPAPDGGELTVLEVPRWELGRSERVALVGPSGSGKSTLLHLLCGIVRPSSGSVQLLGERLDRMKESSLDRLRASQVGYVHQSFQLLPGFTALENVLAAAAFGSPLSKRRQRERAAELLADAGLADRLDHLPRQLSQGQQQRVAIARALVNEPSLLLADEPTASLDPETADRVMELLAGSAAASGAALLLCTHDMDLAARMERIVTMKEISARGSAAPMPPERPRAAIG
ncbi:ABC transporter ATP-binding protein [Paenibacillus albicereus]|uniref:ABC transporter ATP-binding protein n=1 Tax=Paenibacillus albicereus TaxID=2726185 RepID=A0A6H2H3X4_9BACL|nr:ABC transporter ATP-binding protein [Paenibacillus albicereus]